MIPNAEQTFKMLEKEPQYKIKIRKDDANPNYVTERVYVNGECIQIPVGETVTVAETVYKCLERKGIL